MALIRDIARRVPQLGHVRASGILVVAGEARRASHATVRPQRFPGTHTRFSRDGRREKPRLRIKGREILYVVTLRPLWFRGCTPEQRVGSVIHELYHCSTRFNGTLHAGRRHARMGPRFMKKVGPMVRRYLAEAPDEVLSPFAHRGLVKVQSWLEKPPASVRPGARARRLYTEDQLFTALVRMTPPR
ncbi:MAG: hypothetical protein JST54_03260 [Deltaproteobacteria bacterium]|nr:hypothetical protein [Deltaproteobacteria bacterium]